MGVLSWAGRKRFRHIGRIEAQDFYQHHYAPNNAILVVAGDVTPQEVREDAEAEYGKVPARQTALRAEFAQPPRLGETRMTIAREDAKVSLFLRDYRVASYTEAKPGEAEALETLAQLLGGDPTSALYRELVVKRKLASDAGASYGGYVRDAGEFEIYAVPRPGVSLDVLGTQRRRHTARVYRRPSQDGRFSNAPRRSLLPTLSIAATANIPWRSPTARRWPSD